MWGTYFRMGAYKCDVVVVIKMGAYIHGVLILCGCLLSRFYGITKAGVAIVKVLTGCGGIPHVYFLCETLWKHL